MSGLAGAGSRTAVPAAKLAAPRPLGRQVSRDRLLDAVAAATPDQILLLSAPAGYGKTALLAEWAAHIPGRLAWVSLGPADRTERALCAVVLAAVRDCPAVSADHPVRQLDAPQDSGATTAFVGRLTAALATLPVPVWLVLDDVHVLAGSPAMGALETLTRYLCGGLVLALATLSDPALPLARWQVADRLIEIRSDRLAFTGAETRALVEHTGLQLRDDQISALVTQTGGWAAGLRLASMSLATTDDADAFLTDLAGNDRAIADYLVSEVLSRLPEDSVSLLRQLSVCDRSRRRWRRLSPRARPLCRC